MKTYRIITISLSLFFLLSCTRDFKDVNTDPNYPAAVSTEYLLTNAEKNMMDYTLHPYCSNYFSLLVSQYWAMNSSTQASRYLLFDFGPNTIFDGFYADALREAEEIIRLNRQHPAGSVSENQIAIARMLKVWMFQQITDIWGPVPYSEALLGAENRTPRYDAQRDIYLDLVKELKESIAQLDAGAGSFDHGDVIYGGDVQKWKRFGNSLLLRVGLRMADVEPELAQKSAEQAAAAGVFTSNGGNAYFRYLDGSPNTHPAYLDRKGNNTYNCMSNVLIDSTLLPLNDPRLYAFADPAQASGLYRGRPFGQRTEVAESEPLELYSQPSGAFAVLGGVAFRPHDVLRPDAPGVYLSYAEVCFALAEACARTWTVPGTAAEWYEKGVRASMEEWGVDDQAAIDTYLAQAAVDYNEAPGDWKQKIGVQKWIALYMQGIQGWSEWRRLDFHKLIPPVDGALVDIGSSPAPLRLTYPRFEQTRNSISYQAAVGLLGGADNMKTRVWWDVK